MRFFSTSMGCMGIVWFAKYERGGQSHEEQRKKRGCARRQRRPARRNRRRPRGKRGTDRTAVQPEGLRRRSAGTDRGVQHRWKQLLQAARRRQGGWLRRGVRCRHQHSANQHEKRIQRGYYAKQITNCSASDGRQPVYPTGRRPYPLQ